MSNPHAGKDAGLFLLTLSCVPGLGPARIHAIVTRFGCQPDLLRASADVFLEIPAIGRSLAEEIAGFLGNESKRRKAENAARQQYEELERHQASLITIIDPCYPALLREIYDPPPVLFIRGSLSEPEPPSIAVVGTRRASAYGKQATGQLAGELASRGMQIVSGLAYGIDTAAHDAAIRAGGRTIAVLAGSVNHVYTDPKGKIWPKIVEHGALISEEWFGSELLPGKFPKRNRIIAGMTLGTLVVESDLKGGSLITASYALEQNREVFAVPGTIYSHNSRGTNRLIQTGQAKAVLETGDVLEELNLSALKIPVMASAQTGTGTIIFSEEERRLLTYLEEGPVHLDALALQTGCEISELLVQLFELELKKAIVQMPGQFFGKNI